MKDLHSHIMFGIDDGSSSLEESITLIKKLVEKGTTDIMLTPHYIEKSNFNCNNIEKEKIFNILKTECINNNINVNLYLGNEVMVNYNILKNIKENNIKTLNNSKYLLIEMPLHKEFEDFDIVIKELINNGIIPVLAHPERYKFVKEDINSLDYYLDLGVLLQGNYESLFDKYGKHSKKILKKLIKNKKISFLGSDIHSLNYEIDTDKLVKTLKKIVKDEAYIKDITINNFDKVINNL